MAPLHQTRYTAAPRGSEDIARVRWREDSQLLPTVPTDLGRRGSSQDTLPVC